MGLDICILRDPQNDSLKAAVTSFGVQADTGHPSTPTSWSVTDNFSATSTILLLPNPLRRGGTITNDSTVTLYVKLGTGASATSYTAPLVSGAYYELPFGYVDLVTGVWASQPGTGSARITELT